MKEIILISTGAIGDMIIASALQKPLNELGYKTGIISAGFTLPLWIGLENITTYAFGKDKALPELPTDAQVVDISNYLAHFPHSQPLPQKFTEEECRYDHLCEWMTYYLFQKIGLKLEVSKADVRIILRPEEVAFGRDYIANLKKENGGKKVLIISPYATTKNRNIPLSTLEEIAAGVSDVAFSCQTTPYGETQKIKGTVDVGDKDIRKSIAIRLAADTYLTVDSGPLHMMMGAMQGTPKDNLVDGVNPDPAKVFVVLGSSKPETVSYTGNQNIFAGNACEISPCGAHGYYPLKSYGRLFGRRFHSSTDSTKDKSGCIYQNFSGRETAVCMESVKAEEVIEKIRGYLDNH